jgi:hypothetical protein
LALISRLRVTSVPSSPEQIDVSLTADPAAVIAQARTRLLEIVDAEVVDAPTPTKEIAR